MLQKAGIQVGAEELTGTHHGSILAVKNGHIDAAGVASNQWESALDKEIFEENELKIIAKSQLIPNSPIVVQKSLSEPTKDKLRAIFQSLTEEIILEQGTKEISYVLGKDEDYNSVREVAEILELDLTKQE